MKVKNCICLSAILLVILMFGCSSDTNTPTISEGNAGQAMLAPNVCYSEAQINSLILTKAASQNGLNTGVECKPWVNNIVYSSTKISLPAMDSYYTWASSAFARIVWQFKPASYCITKFPTYLLPGQIMQIKWRPSYINGPHTIIISAVSSDSISYWECNGHAGKYTVGSWKDLIGAWQSHAEAWTVYQVKSY